MDASCVFDLKSTDDLNKTENSDFVGSKFSSGVLPPEMFYELKGEAEEKAYRDYWATRAAAARFFLTSSLLW
jgi:hypothetical protein